MVTFGNDWMLNTVLRMRDAPPDTTNRIVTATARDGSVQFHTHDGRWTPDVRRACVYDPATATALLVRVDVPVGHVRGMLTSDAPAVPLDALPRMGARR